MSSTNPVFTSCRLLLVACALFAGSAQATDYVIEVVLFEHRTDEDGSQGSLWYPKLGRTIGLGSEAAEEAGFIKIEDNLLLAENASSIASSRRYRVLRHLAWQQPGLDERNAKAIRISLGRVFDAWLPEDTADYDQFIPASGSPVPERTREIRSTTLNGSIKVRLGRFLHMEVLLVYTDPESGKSYRLSESRKMRSRELHYIDNPRFGLLTKILPVDS